MGPDSALHALVEHGPFDCLVTDYAMPGMNGGELVAKAQALCPGLPALIITGWADIDDLEQLGQHTQVLRKPFKRDAILQHVTRLLAAAGGAANQLQLTEET